MTVVAVATVTAISFRVWRLLAHDRITQPIRNLWNPETKTGELIDYWFGCPWCAGTWWSLGITGLWAATHTGFGLWDYFGVAAAASVFVGLVGDRTA